MTGFIWFIAVTINCVIWGVVTYVINTNKGYEGGFWWGFFLEIIGLIVVLCKPDNHSRVDLTSSPLLLMSEGGVIVSSSEDQSILASGGWRCRKCGRVNASFIGTCGCGTTKGDNGQSPKISNIANGNSAPTTNNANNNAAKSEMTESEVADALLKFKSLLDMGVLTEEEFNKKKDILLSKNTLSEGESETSGASSSPFSHAEEILLKIIEKNAEGVSGVQLSKMIPRTIAPKEVSSSLNHLIEMSLVEKNSEGYYIKKQ